MESQFYKLEIFVPESHFAQVRAALWAVDAGHIGGYDRCLSWSAVDSCWRPLAGTRPYLGREDELCVAREIKVEACCTGQRLKETLEAVKGAHPYEQPVINVLPLLATGL